jgi:hypothetical protein
VLMSLKSPEEKRKAQYQIARAWLDKHGTARRSNVSDGYRVIVSAHGLGAEGYVKPEPGDDETTDYENAFIDAVEQLRSKLGPLGNP